jgi:signal transduction histidine kinase/CheY-like chemotaxis protein
MFPLVRYFSLLSACLITALTALIAYEFTRHDQSDFARTAERRSAIIATVLYNTVLAPYVGYIGETEGMTRAALLERPETWAIDAKLAASVRGGDVLKVDIFNLAGLTIYSSEHTRIGRAKGASVSISALLSGRSPLSKFYPARSIVGFDGALSKVDVMGTYVPQFDDSGRPVAILEIYTDITANLALQRHNRWRLVAMLVAGFCALYLALFAVVRRAGVVLARQHRELDAFNRSLEARVAERTMAAEHQADVASTARLALESEVVERRRIEHELVAQREWLLRQQSALGGLMRRGDLTGEAWQKALSELMAVLMSMLKVDRAAVWIYNSDRTQMERIALVTQLTQYCETAPLITLVTRSPYFFALENDDIVAVEDVTVDERVAEFRCGYFDNTGVRAMLDAAIVRSGVIQGAIGVGHVGGTRQWKPEEQTLASTIASLVALVLEARDRREIEQRLRASNVALEKATRVKSQFLATMSHEIRTPMNGVLGMLTQLQHEPLTPRQKQMSRVALQSGEGLLSIIDDILDVTRIEGGKLELEHIAFDVGAVLTSVVELLEPKARDKGLVCSVSHIGLPPAAIYGDPGRLRQVLFNLIGNAVKFTAQGSIDIVLTWLPIDAGRVGLRLDVRDTGIGIDAEAQGRLFELFSQADASTTRRFGGTGLGLAISRELIELMGGRLTLSSMPGVGSTFSIELTAACASLAPASDEHALERYIAPDMRILVAEDNEVNQLVIETLLQSIGCTSVDIVKDGAAAIEAVRFNPRYSVVLMDVQMPVMDGIAATRAIRALEGPMSVTPIVALTANVFDADRSSYRAAGMDGFLSKPVRVSDLAAELERVVGVIEPRRRSA